MNFWVNTVSREHVLAGVAGGFTQAGHGAKSGLARLRLHDRIVFYSPREALRSGAAVQAFTALGVVVDEEPHQVEMRPGFNPWRRRVRFEEVAAAPIAPLKETLAFLGGGSNWGLPFRRGLFTIPEADFILIADAMGWRPSSAAIRGRGSRDDCRTRRS